MSDKFSLYKADGFWGIIENASNEKQTSIKSYFGSDLIIKRLNEQADQINQLKQQLDEKDIRIEELEGQFAYECECNKQLVELQKQLEKKQNEIDEINKEFVQAVHDWKALCAEKDKEIERLKSEIVKECKEHQEFIKEAKQITNQLKSNYQTQLAIQELEKTLNFIENVFDKALKNCSLNSGYYDQILDFIDQQIKELKGEKDGTDR